jgi:crotonobetainyl-CoA:carnitine CoA-transferase CaiB-like acyl-CoA transferase
MALGGVTVLDLTRLLPGPYCTMLLAGMGADVVKVEEPGRGDPLRAQPPLANGRGAVFDALNGGKRSVTLNLKSADGRRLFKALAARADVVLEGNRPGVMDRLGVGWSVLRELNPRLVMCAITGYGQTGPLARRAGHDINYMALAGALSMNARGGESPHPLSVQVADLGGVQSAAVAILGALLEVARGGQGRFIDVSMTDGAASWLVMPFAERRSGGTVAAPGMHALTGRFACYDVYRCADGGHMAVGALEPKFWSALCEAIDRPDLVADQYDDSAQDRLRAELAAVFGSRARDEWVAILEGREVCCEPVLGLDEVMAHPHLQARGLFRDGGKAGPGLGEHTAQVLAEAGLATPGELERLRAEGAV